MRTRQRFLSYHAATLLRRCAEFQCSYGVMLPTSLPPPHYLPCLILCGLRCAVCAVYAACAGSEVRKWCKQVRQRTTCSRCRQYKRCKPNGATAPTCVIVQAVHVLCATSPLRLYEKVLWLTSLGEKLPRVHDYVRETKSSGVGKQHFARKPGKANLERP